MSAGPLASLLSYRSEGGAQLRMSRSGLQVSFRGMPLYAMLPTITEYCVEQGWTLAYARYGKWRGWLGGWAYA